MLAGEKDAIDITNCKRTSFKGVAICRKYITVYHYLTRKD